MAYIHDPYPFASYPRPYDHVEAGHQQKRNFFLKVSEKAQFAAFPSKLLAEWMESYYPSLKGKEVIIPHQIDEDRSEPAGLPAYFKKDAFTIVHAGALMSARNPMGLVKAFQQFLKEVPEAAEKSQLVFLGKKSRYSGMFEEVKRHTPQVYSSEENLAFREVQAIQENAAVNLILEAKGPFSPFLPGKFPHCIEAGKPVLLLGPYYSESRRLLGDNYPWWSEIHTSERITALIRQLFEYWKAGKDEVDYKKMQYYLSRENLQATINALTNRS
jgi:glycosyltransferase involved in cell wall biosynthesis